MCSLSSTPDYFPVDDIENLTSAVESHQLTYTCAVPVRRLCPICVIVFLCRPLRSNPIYVVQLRPSLVCADKEAAFHRGLVVNLLMALECMLTSQYISVCGVIKVTNNSHSPACAEGLVEMSKLVCGEHKFYSGLLLVIISPPLETPPNSPGVVSKVGLRS